MNEAIEVKQAGMVFLEENLERHFKAKDYCVIGLKGPSPATTNRVNYVTYGFEVDCDVPGLTGQHRGLVNYLDVATRYIDTLIDGLVRGKEAEKPECAELIKRAVCVHFREFPNFTYQAATFDERAKLHCFIRIHVCHSHRGGK